MDPLSLTTGILAVLGAAGAILQAIQKLSDLQNAPREIHRLTREIASLQRLCTEIFDLLSTTTAVKKSSSALCSDILFNTQETLSEVKSLVHLCTRPQSGSNHFRIDWLQYTRSRTKLKEARESLQAYRLDLVLGLGFLNIQTVLSTKHDLENHLSTVETLSSVKQDQIIDQLEQQTLLIEQLTSQPQRTTLLSPVTFPSDPPSYEMPSRHIEAPHLPLWKQTQCQAWCNCRCHQKQQVSTFQGVVRAVGSLHLVCLGLSSSKSCNEISCYSRAIPFMHGSYYPPRWASQRLVSFKIAYSPLDGVQLSIKTPRLICGSSRVFHHAVGGNIDAIRCLFTDHLASPFDVDARTGESVLHYAVQNRHKDLAKALVAYGADPHQEDRNNRTAADIAWNDILHGHADIDTWGQVAKDVNDLDVRQFSALHKTVLRLSSVDVASQLSLSSTDLNSRDFHGRTPLSWACARGDCNSVRALLKYKADTEIPCRQTGKTPLHFAVEKGRLDCIQMLVEAGANVNQVDNQQRTVLHMVSEHSEHATAIIEHLLSLPAVFNFEARDKTGATPLLVASGCGNLHLVNCLLANHVDINTSDQWGYTPFLQALCYNHINMWLRLLDQGAQYISTAGNKYNAIHLAAHYANAEAMRTLLKLVSLGKFSLESFDPKAKAGAGLTAREIIQQTRPEASPELLDLFERLMKEVEEQYKQIDEIVIGVNPDDSDEVTGQIQDIKAPIVQEVEFFDCVS